MGKPEVKTTAALQAGLALVLDLLLMGQGVPDPLTLLVAENVVGLGEEEAGNGQKVDDNEELVAAVVEGGVVGAVNVRANDATKLDADLVRLAVNI